MIFLEEVGFKPGSAKNVKDKNHKAVALSITPRLLINCYIYLTGYIKEAKYTKDLKWLEATFRKNTNISLLLSPTLSLSVMNVVLLMSLRFLLVVQKGSKQPIFFFYSFICYKSLFVESFFSILLL